MSELFVDDVNDPSLEKEQFARLEKNNFVGAGTHCSVSCANPDGSRGTHVKHSRFQLAIQHPVQPHQRRTGYGRKGQAIEIIRLTKRMAG
ncbi:hypothetical protein [Burkholderia ubonensis]|uniref:hypothetical protein n=1 Tax=Burkholderia ubonensis TaxID=101571 RepID=UPI0012F82CA5|nr:hypothetical protein [Burkholderia ubonensis]